jgi:hypothetical protein
MATFNYGGSADTQERIAEQQITAEKYAFDKARLAQLGLEPTYQPGVSYGAMDPDTRAQFLKQYYNYDLLGDPQSLVPAVNTGSDFASILKMITGGSGDGSSKLTSADVALKELQYKKEQDALKAAQTAAANKALSDYYTGGAYTTVDPEVLAKIQSMSAAQTADVNRAYEDAIANIGAGYSDALGLAEKGYTALEDYLRANPNDPYAGLTARTGTVTNPMETLLSAYGVAAEPVRAQVAAEQLAGQQGGQAFQDLINVLSRASQSADLSRLAETQMGREVSRRTLGSQKAGLSAQASKAQADALSQIAQRQREQELEQELARIKARRDLEEQLIAAGIVPPKGSGAGGALTELEQAIRASGGNTTEAQFQQGLADLASALSAFQPGQEISLY